MAAMASVAFLGEVYQVLLCVFWPFDGKLGTLPLRRAAALVVPVWSWCARRSACVTDTEPAWWCPAGCSIFISAMSCLEFFNVIVDTDCLVLCAWSLYLFTALGPDWNAAENRFGRINEDYRQRVARKIW
jgi:hypothetical protein